MRNDIQLQPLVSVIVPVYNSSLFLVKCVNSILAQSYPFFEIILVDDGSTDGSGKLCDQISDKDKRIKVVHQPNQGVVKARMAGLKLSRGKYICFVDGDDYIHQEMLKQMLVAIETNQVDMVICQYYDVVGQQVLKSKMRPIPGLYDRDDIKRLLQTIALYDPATKIAGMPFFACCKMYNRDIVPLVLERGLGLWYEEDLVGNLAALYTISGMYVLPDYLYYYVKHSEQATKTFKEDILKNLLEVVDRIEEIDAEGYLEKQLPSRILMELGSILSICAGNHRYSLFRNLCFDIYKNNKLQKYLKQCNKNASRKDMLRLFLLQGKMTFLYYHMILLKKWCRS